MFFRRCHSQYAASAKPIDNFARNICLPIDGGGIKLLIKKLPNLAERLVQFSLLRGGNAWIRHYPIRDKATKKKPFGKTYRLWPGEEKLLGLLNFFLSLCVSLSH